MNFNSFNNGFLRSLTGGGSWFNASFNVLPDSSGGTVVKTEEVGNDILGQNDTASSSSSSSPSSSTPIPVSSTWGDFVYNAAASVANQIVHVAAPVLASGVGFVISSEVKQTLNSRESDLKELEKEFEGYDSEIFKIYQLVSSIATDQISNNLRALDPLYKNLINNVAPDEYYVHLVRCNIAIGFSNLIKEMEEDLKKVAENTPKIIALVLHLSKKVGHVLTPDEVQKLISNKEDLEAQNVFFDRLTNSLMTSLFPQNIKSLKLPQFILNLEVDRIGFSVPDLIYKQLQSAIRTNLSHTFNHSPEVFLDAAKIVNGSTNYFESLLNHKEAEERLLDISPKNNFFVLLAKVFTQDVVDTLLPQYIGKASELVEEFIDILGIGNEYKKMSNEQKNTLLNLMRASECTVSQLVDWAKKETQEEIGLDEEKTKKLNKILSQIQQIALNLDGVAQGIVDSIPITDSTNRSKKQKDIFDLAQKMVYALGCDKELSENEILEFLTVLDTANTNSGSVLNCISAVDYWMRETKKWKTEQYTEEMYKECEKLCNQPTINIEYIQSVPGRDNKDVSQSCPSNSPQFFKDINGFLRGFSIEKDAFFEKCFERLAEILEIKESTLLFKTKLKEMMRDSSVPAQNIINYINSPRLSDDLEFKNTTKNIENAKAFLEGIHKEKVDIATEIDSLLTGFLLTNPKDKEFIGSLVHGILLKVFTMLCEKNPAREDQDPVVVIIEKLESIISDSWEDISYLHKVSEDDQDPLTDDAIAENLSRQVFSELFHIGEVTEQNNEKVISLIEELNWLPSSVKELIFNKIKEQILALVTDLRYTLRHTSQANSSLINGRTIAEKYGKDEATGTGKPYLELILNDLMGMVVPSVLESFAENGATSRKGVNIIGKQIELLLKGMIKGNLATGNLLLNEYPDLNPLKKLIEENLAAAVDLKYKENRETVAHATSGILLEPLSQFIDKSVTFEKQHNEKFYEELLVNLIGCLGNHIKNLRLAKEKAKGENRKLSHQDYVDITNTLHPAIPKKLLGFEESLKEINKIFENKLEKNRLEQIRECLLDIVNKENQGMLIISPDSIIQAIEGKGILLSAIAKRSLKASNLVELVRADALINAASIEKEALAPSAKIMMKLLFPEGEKSLTFVAESYRSQVWNLLQETLFPIIMGTITELLLDPLMIPQLIVDNLNGIVDLLNQEITIDDPATVPAEVQQERAASPILDEVAGELVAQLLELTTFPTLMKNLPDYIKRRVDISSMIYDPETKQVPESVKKLLGSKLLDLFGKNFLEKTLNDQFQGLAGVSTVDPKNRTPFFVHVSKNAKEKKDELSKAKKEIEDQMKTLPKRLLEAAVSNYVRKTWISLQKHLDEKFAYLGKIGIGLKKELDKVFNYVFQIILTSFIASIFKRKKDEIIELIFDKINLHDNVESVIDIFKYVPEEQLNENNGISYINEDLLFKLSAALADTVEQFNRAEQKDESVS